MWCVCKKAQVALIQGVQCAGGANGALVRAACGASARGACEDDAGVSVQLKLWATPIFPIDQP